jgi:hypothetical protein
MTDIPITSKLIDALNERTKTAQLSETAVNPLEMITQLQNGQRDIAEAIGQLEILIRSK